VTYAPAKRQCDIINAGQEAMKNNIEGNINEGQHNISNNISNTRAVISAIWSGNGKFKEEIKNYVNATQDRMSAGQAEFEKG
jgi:predicted AAA+ superfamily ATPase